MDGQDASAPCDPIGCLQVSLDGKLIEQLTPLLLAMGLGGKLFFNGQLLGEEDSALSSDLKNEARLLLVANGAVGKVEPIMWFRTKKTSCEWNDSCNLSTSDFDALCFKAKRDVYFCGFGMLKTYSGDDFVLEFKYRVRENIDGESNEEAYVIEVDSTTSPKNEENMHWFDI